MTDAPPPPPPPPFGDAPFGGSPFGSPPPPPPAPPPGFQPSPPPSWSQQGPPPAPGAGMGPMGPAPYGGGLPAYQGTAFGGQQASGPPARGMAIAAMVLGIVGLLTFFLGVAAILAVIFGIIVLRRVKRAPALFTGRGMALAGLITGILGILAGAAFWVFVGTQIAGKTQLANVEVGDCLKLPSGTIRFGVEKQSCSSPHEGEVFSTPAFPTPGSYPGQQQVIRQLSVACSADFEGYVGSSPATSALRIFLVAPTQSQWDRDASFRVICIAHNDDNSPLTETVKDSNR